MKKSLFIAFIALTVFVFTACKDDEEKPAETPTYTVTFNTGVDGPTVTSAPVKAGATVTKPTDPEKAGHDFDGWFKEETLANAWNFTSDTVTANTTLYAKWTPFADVNDSGIDLPKTADSEAIKVNANLNITSIKKSTKTDIIYITLGGSTVAVDSTTGIAIPEGALYGDMFDPKTAAELLKEDAIKQGFSAFVIAGVVDLAQNGHIKQYNQGLNAWKAVAPADPQVTFGFGTPDVYRVKSYAGGTDSYAPDSLEGFDIVLWGGASSKVITLEVTQPQDATTKTIYKIDYSAVDIKKPAAANP
ncbi:hypothetical protein PilKf_01484 [Pillotina sp. SPG140]|jgi:uncharacterized repeat protein (TIGR02543 family)